MSPRRSNEQRAKWRGKCRKVLSKYIGKTRRRSQVSSYQCRLYNSRLLSPRLADADCDIAPWFTVCNYSPAGNVEGEYVMNVVEHQWLPHSFSSSNTPKVVGKKKIHLPHARCSLSPRWQLVSIASSTSWKKNLQVGASACQVSKLRPK